MKFIDILKYFFIITLCSLCFFTNVYAYIGLAPLVPLIGQAIVWVVVGVIAILGFIAYPLKLLINKNKKNKSVAKKK
jgi:phage shock protein PspC (stress-responsive transcriptional regulator)